MIYNIEFLNSKTIFTANISFVFQTWAFVGRWEWFQNKRGTNSGWLNSLWQYPVADEGDKIEICVTQRVVEE